MEFYAKEGDLRLGVNWILTLDALVGLLHQEKLPEKGAGPKGKVRGKDEDFRNRLGQVGRISDRPGYSGCEAWNLNPRAVLQVRDLADFGVGAVRRAKIG